MFTGVVEETGVIKSVARKGRNLEIAVSCGQVLEDLKTGHSVAVDGACLTVEKLMADGFSAFVSEETASRTTLKSVRPGARVNLERALRVTDRLHGHLVQGHVDTTAVIVRDKPAGGGLERTFRLEGDFKRHLAEKGSVTCDGVSLTLASVNGKEFSVSLIPETLKRTTQTEKKPGDKVNVETDVLAKYAEALMKERHSGLTMQKLQESGF